MLIRGPTPLSSIRATSPVSSSALWPPLKSARYCKKQKQRNLKSRAFTPSIMLMHESSINHHRVSSALNELSNGNNFCLFEQYHHRTTISSIWSRKQQRTNSQIFWNEYLECDEEFSKASQEFSLLSIYSSDASDDTCPRACYTKITKSIRKLLKRTFTGAPTFAELENLVTCLINNSNTNNNNQYKFSCGQVLNLSDLGATIQLDTPFHRVWLHAICQYHGLSSQSKTVQEDRLVFINFCRSKKFESSDSEFKKPKMTLYKFLLQL